MKRIEITEAQAEIIYLALSKSQDALTDTATDEEYYAFDTLMNLVINA